MIGRRLVFLAVLGEGRIPELWLPLPVCDEGVERRHVDDPPRGNQPFLLARTPSTTIDRFGMDRRDDLRIGVTSLGLLHHAGRAALAPRLRLSGQSWSREGDISPVNGAFVDSCGGEQVPCSASRIDTRFPSSSASASSIADELK